MLVYAGIDEAGYGPMLGPLCVACSVFVVPDHAPESGPCDLWKRLSNAICRKKTDRRRRIAIDDSKKLKNPNDAPGNGVHPLKHLERGVLAMLLAGCDGDQSTCPACDGDLYSRLGAHVSDAAWYQSITPLPVAHSVDELRIATARLRNALQAHAITCPFIRCEAIHPEQFNQQVSVMGSKASVNFCAVMRMIEAVWKRWPAEHPRIIVDRLGGRDHYLNDLMHAFPEAQVQVLAETDTLSRYRLSQGGSMLTVSFLVEAESEHLPVALASMTAKYVRELQMMRLNRYFQGYLPELKPTAGYTEDARRYLADIAELMNKIGVPRQALVRSV